MDIEMELPYPVHVGERTEVGENISQKSQPSLDTLSLVMFEAE